MLVDWRMPSQRRVGVGRVLEACGDKRDGRWWLLGGSRGVSGHVHRAFRNLGHKKKEEKP